MSETNELSEKNGVTEAATEAAVVAETKAEKPWIAAGFKTRDEWRASKGQKTGKTTKEPAMKKAKPAKTVAMRKAIKTVKKDTKVLKKLAKQLKKGTKAVKKVTAEVKKTAKEKAAAHERTLKLKKLMAKRTEANDKEKKVLAAFGGIGKTKTIEQLGEKAFPGKSKVIQRSWVRNCLRWTEASKHTKHVDRGTYQRVA